MGKTNLKKLLTLMLAMVLLVGVAPFSALASDTEVTTKAIVEKKTIEVGEEFEVIFKSSDSENIKFEIPDGLTFLSAQALIEETDKTVTIQGGRDTSAKFIANTSGDYEMYYTDGDISDKLEIDIVDKKEEIDSPEETPEEEVVDPEEIIVDSEEIIVEPEEIIEDSEETVENYEEVEPNPDNRLVESDADLSVDFVGYNDSVGLDSKATLDLNIKFDFGPGTTNKELEINLPEGLRYVQIPVADNYNTANVDSNIINKLLSTEAMYSAIDSVELPQREGTTPNYKAQTYGKLKYKFKNNIQSGELKVRVKIDSTRYYGEHTALEAVSVETLKNGVSSGRVDKKLKYVGDTNILSYLSVLNPGTSTGIVGKTGVMSKKLFSMDISKGLDNNPSWVKEIEIHAHYPQGMTNPKVVSNYDNSDLDITNIPSESKLIIKGLPDVWMTSIEYTLSYDIPLGLAEGEYKTIAKDKIIVKYYDNTFETREANKSSLEKVDIVSTYVNSLTFVGGTSFGYTDDQGVKPINSLANFNLENNLSVTITDQVMEMNFDPGVEIRTVKLPVDKSLTVGAISVKYKTNKNASFRSYSVPPINNNANAAVMSASDVGLAQDEYFTEIIADIGDFSPGVALYNPSAPTSPIYPSVFGSISDGSTGSNITVSVYDKNDKNGTIRTTTRKPSLNSSKPNRSTASRSNTRFLNDSGVFITQIEPGESFTLETNVIIHDYRYGTDTFVNKPILHFRQSKDTVLDINSTTIVQYSGGSAKQLVRGVDWNYSTHTNTAGDTIFDINFINDATSGVYSNDKLQTDHLKVDVKYNTTRKLKGVINNRDLFAFSTPGLDALNINNHGFIDVHDLNGNGNTTEIVHSAQDRNLNVNDLNSVLLESFISVEGEGNKLPYDPSNPDTAVIFNPGTDARYYIDVMNYTIEDSKKAVMYIPIPKTGLNYGSNFQTEDFKWNMQLSSGITLPPEMVGKFKVSYATDVNSTNWETTSYYETMPYYSDVRMIKIENLVDVPVDAEYSFSIPMKVDETYESAQQGGKLGTLNIYNPLIVVESNTFSGTVKGTGVGAQLDITKIGGTVFIDQYRTGQYDGTTNNAVKGRNVYLYKENESTGVYEPVLDSANQPVFVVTDGLGKYEFDYSHGLRQGNYGVKFGMMDGHELTFHGGLEYSRRSHAINVKNVPNPGDDYRGWAIGIKATDPVSDRVNAGYIKYSPDMLGVKIQEKDRKISDKQTMTIPLSEVTVTPSEAWFENFKDDPALVWSAKANSSQVTLSGTEDSDLLITPKPLAGGSKDVEIIISLHDIFGNVIESNTVIVTIYSTTPPTFIGNTIVVSVGDSADLSAGFTATDNAGNTITLTGSNYTVTSTVPIAVNKYTTAGTYEITHVVKDQYGNEGTHTRLVRVMGLPTIVANPQVYDISDSDILGQVTAAASASYLEAPQAVGAAVDKSVPTTMNIVSGPSTSNFNQAGLYSVEYKASNSQGKESTKTVNVLVKSETAITEDSLVLEATGFIIENADASSLTNAIAKDSSHGDVKAYKVVENAGAITSITDVTHKATANSTHLSAIKAVSTLGGVFDLEFKVTDGDVVSKTVKVAVKGTNTEIIDDFAVTFKDYTVAKDEVPTTVADKEDQVKDPAYGNVSITSIIDSSKNPVAINIDTSNYVSEIGTYEVTFKASAYPNVTGKLNVTVKDNAVVDNGYKISANDIVISKHEATDILNMSNLDKSNYFTTEMNPSVEKVDGSPHNAVAVYNTTNLQAVAGTYDVEFYASTSTSTKVKAKVHVLDKDVVVVDGQYVIAANHFMIGLLDLPTTPQDLVNRSLAVVYHRDDLTTNLGATTATVLNPVLGHQDVTFKAANLPASSQTNLKAIVDAEVVDNSVVDGDKYVLQSKNEITIQRFEALQYIAEGTGKNKTIIGVAEAKAFKQGDLTTTGNVVLESYTYTGTSNGVMILKVEEDPSISKTVIVRVVDPGDPLLEVIPTTVYVELGDQFDYKDGVSATDTENPTFNIDWDSGNLKITPLYGAPDPTSLDTSAQGVYTYQYSATSKNGVTVTENRIVVVQDDDHPIEIVNDYYVVAKNIMKKPSDFDTDDDINKGLILDYSDAYAVHKTTGVREDVVVSNLNGFTNVVGQYSVGLRPDVTGITKDHNIKIVLTDGGIEENGKYLITAENATVGKSRAREIIADTTNNELLTEMNVVAIHKTNPTAIVTIGVSGKPTSETPAASHPIKYVVQEDVTSTITRTLKITNNEEVDVVDKIYLGANPFVVGRENVVAMNADGTYTEYLKLSSANSYNIDTPATTYKVVPVTFLDEAGSENQLVEFGVLDTDNSTLLAEPRVVVNVKVKGDRSTTLGNYTLVGDHFTITGAQALELKNTPSTSNINDSILLTGGSLTSYLHQDPNFTLEGTPVVLDRSSIDTTVGPHDVVFGIAENPNLKLTLKVSVGMAKAPTINIKNYSFMSIGDTFDAESQYLSGFDHNDSNSAIPFTSLTVDTSNIDNSVVGLYEVTYSYTDVAGLTTTKLHVVAVDDTSIVDDSEYIVYAENVVLKTNEVTGDVDELVKSKSNVKAYLKANDTGDIEEVDYSDITMDASTVTATPGHYTAEIGVTSKSNLKTIMVKVTDGNIHPGDGYTIVTKDTTIGQKDAAKSKSEIDTLIIAKSETYAVHKTLPILGVIEASHSITPTVKSYDVTYSVASSTESADAKVNVIADEVVENEGNIYVAANSFLIGAENVGTMTDSDYIEHAKAHVWEVNSDSGVKSVRYMGPGIDATKIDQLQPADYGVKLNATDLTKPIARVDIKVIEGKTERGDNYTLNGKHFTISGAEAFTLVNTVSTDDSNDDILLDGGELRSFLNNSFVESGTPIVLDRSAINTANGTYEVIFGIKEDSSVKLTLNVTVALAAAPTLNIHNYSFVNVGDTFNAEAQYIDGFDHSDSDAPIPYNKLTVDTSAVDTSVVGLYEVTYSYTDKAGRTTTELHIVAVQDGSIEDDVDYLIYGQNVVLKTSEVTGDINELVKSKSQAKAYKKSNSNGKIEAVPYGNITMDASSVVAKAGEYTATIGVSGKSAEKDIRVIVTDGEIHVKDEYTIITSNISIGQTDAAKPKNQLDPLIIAKSGTIAVHKTLATPGSIEASHSISTTIQDYDVTYKVVESSESADAIVTVVGDDIVENNGSIHIGANSFVIGEENLPLTDAEYISNAKANAWEVDGNSGIKSVRFIGSQLDETNILTPQPLQYGVNLDGTELSKPIANVEALVLEGKTERGDDYTLNGKNFTITGAEALALVNTPVGNTSNDGILLTGGNVRAYKNNELTPSGTPYVFDRTAIKAQKGTYNVVYALPEDTSIKLTLKVTVDMKDNAELNIIPYSTLNLNDTFNEQAQFIDGTDFNDNDRPIVFSEINVDSTAIDNTKVGFYTVRYSYTDVAGNITSRDHIVAVTDGSIVDDPEYLIYGENVVLKTSEVVGDVNALVKTKANPSAYKKTPSNGDLEAVDYDDITMDASSVLKKQGTYTATIGINGKTDSKTIQVYVTDGDIHPNDEYTIITNDISIGQKDAAKPKVELDQLIINKSNTIAVHKTSSVLGTIAATHTIDTTVKAHDVIYSVIESTESAQALVHVLADEIVENDGYIYIAANSFVIGEENVDAMTDNTYINHAKAHAWEDKTNSGTKSVRFIGPRVSKTTIDTPQPVSFGVNLNGTTELNKPIAEVSVVVLKGKTERGDDYTLNGQDFEISGTDAYTLMNTVETDDSNDGILLTGGTLRSYKNNELTPSGTPYVIDRSEIKNENGTYDVLFGIKEDDTVKLTLKVTVKMPKETDLVIKPYSEIDVNGTFVAKDQFISGRDHGISYDITFADLTVDETEINTAKKGIYEVKYSYVDSSGRTVERIHVLIVNDGSIVIADDEFIIDANNFMIDEKDVKVDDENHVLEQSNAKSYRISDNKWVDTVVKDYGGYKDEKGHYTITLQVKDEVKAVKEIIAEVVFGDIKPGVEYLISATDMTLGTKDAQTITNSELIARANAVAIHKTLNTSATVRVRETNLQSIPGDYTITFEVLEDPTTFITTNIKVLEEDIVVEDKEYVVAANNFAIGDQYILEMTKEDIVVLAQARAYAKKDPSIPLDVTQTEDIITTIGNHVVSFHIISNPSTSVKVDKTIFKDTMYEIEAFDAEISIDDLTKTINSNSLDQTILTITKTKGSKIEADGTRTSMPVYIADKSALVNAKSGDKVEVVLTLKDPNSKSTRDVNTNHRLEDTTLPVMISVTGGKDGKGEEKDKNGGGVGTGIFDNTIQILSVLFGAIGLLLVVLLSEKKKRKFNKIN